MTTPVRTFVEHALYDPERGFYETRGRAGRRGASFVTSPEVGPLFGAVVARALDAWWREAGEPAAWHVVDAGAGPGTLARSILAARPACSAALHLTCVERSAAQRALHPDTVASSIDLPAFADVILANELLDNLQFDLLERVDDRWVEVAVAPDGSTVPDTGRTRVPVCTAAAAWVAQARRVAPRVVVFDYADTTGALAVRPWTDWVRAFAGHERVADPFADPGSRDITVVVPTDQLPPTEWVTQAAWLRRWGIDDLVAQGEQSWAAAAAAPDLDALTKRSRSTEAVALLEPAGLGAHLVGEWTRPATTRNAAGRS